MADAKKSETKDTSMKGCSDGANCAKRNTCKRWRKRETFSELLAFFVIFQPDCNFYIKDSK